MSVTSTRAVLKWILCLATACGGSAEPLLADVPAEERPAAPVLPAGYPLVGEPCAVEDIACGWSTTIPRFPALLRCSGGAWELAERCEEACEAKKQCSAGCAVTDGGAACLCTPGASSCGQKTSCRDHARVMVPDGPDIECVIECRKSGDFSFAEGCGTKSPGGDEECLCATIGATCDPAWRGGHCVGPALADSNSVLLVTDAIADCVDGVWSAKSCSDYCNDPLATCRGYHTEERHACSCDLE